MNCPFCGYEKTKIEYQSKDCESIKRKRCCESCNERFDTIEIENDLFERFVENGKKDKYRTLDAKRKLKHYMRG